MASVDPTQSKQQTPYYEVDVPTPPPPKVTDVEPSYTNSPTPSVACMVAGVRATLYVNRIAPEDVRQGPIADCTLYAVLASLARTPIGQAVIRSKIEVISDAQGCEAWRVSLCSKDLSGFHMVKVDVTTRDLHSLGPMGAERSGASIEAWPRVYEAAILKLKGAPCLTAADSFAVLTGRPSTDSSTSARDFEQKLTQGFGASKIQTLITTGALKEEITTPVHLRPDHAYAVMRVTTRDGQTCVEVRDPWGTGSQWLTLDQVKQYFPTYTEAAVM